MQFSTAYYKRGFLLEDHGLIWQPMVDFAVNPYHSNGFLTDLSFDIGTRESVHTNDSGARRSPAAPGPRATSGWAAPRQPSCTASSLDTTWVEITSPNDYFQTIQEWDWKVTLP